MNYRIVKALFPIPCLALTIKIMFIIILIDMKGNYQYIPDGAG